VPNLTLKSGVENFLKHELYNSGKFIISDLLLIYGQSIKRGVNVSLPNNN